MAKKRYDQDHDRETVRKFKQQQRRLNRKRWRNAVSGIVVLAVAFIILQRTPYRDLPYEIFDTVKNKVQDFFSSGPAKPAERDPTYW